MDKKCKRCGKIFNAKNGNVLYCDPCREIVKKETTARSHAKQKLKREEKKKTKQRKSTPLDEFCAEIREYNQKHGTRLSYGKYKTLLHFGKIKVKEG